MAGRDFEITGYGIADWVWFGWQSEQLGDGSAVAMERIQSSVRVSAFELKISDWKKAIRQAFRYSYFADLAVVVLPPETAGRAGKQIELFRARGVALWSFDAKTDRIEKLYTPDKQEARSSLARRKAIELLVARSNLRKLRETT